MLTCLIEEIMCVYYHVSKARNMLYSHKHHPIAGKTGAEVLVESKRIQW